MGFLAPLWRGVDVFRAFSLIYAVVLYSQRYPLYDRPVAGWAVLGAMAAWTAWIALRRVRPTRLLVTDLVLACAAVLSTGLVDDPDRIAAGEQTLPVMWPAAAVLSWAIWRGWRTGVVAALTVAVADVVVVGGAVSAATLHNIVLLLLLGGVVGYCADLYRGSRQALARALQVEAATRERERLARGIHDSVLQVLAYVQRRGAEIGGDAAELGRLAGEEEERLRSLVSSRAVPAVHGSDGSDGTGGSAEVDLRGLLAGFIGPGVTISSPAEPVLLAHPVAAELAAAVAAALDNVRRHAGEPAKAWVLLEDEGRDVVVTVRDDGIGIAPGRLQAAQDEGRLGVAQSVRGRIADLGGTSVLHSNLGQGTEVELRVPRKVSA